MVKRLPPTEHLARLRRAVLADYESSRTGGRNAQSRIATGAGGRRNCAESRGDVQRGSVARGVRREAGGVQPQRGGARDDAREDRGGGGGDRRAAGGQ